MFKEEYLQKWGLTQEECEKQIKKITLPGMRLTQNEKEQLFFNIHELGDDPTNIQEQKEFIEFSRQLEKEIKEETKLVKKFVKEWKRLKMKYSSLNSDLQDKSLDELTEMWMNNYFELYFMGDHFDCLAENPKGYAQYYCYNVGICPVEEVSIWK